MLSLTTPRLLIRPFTLDDLPASIGVMRKLGMRVERNLLAEPPWRQVVGIIESSEDFGNRRLSG